MNYNSESEIEMMEKILSVKKNNKILSNTGRNDKKQLIENIKEFIMLIYRNPEFTEFHNVNIRDPNENVFSYFRDDIWHDAPIIDFFQTFLLNLQMRLKKTQKPLEYYIGLDDGNSELIKDDPLGLMKHLDAYVNNDVGYGWGDLKMLVTKNELIDSLKSIFSCKHTFVDNNAMKNDIPFSDVKQTHDYDIVLSDTINNSILTYNVDETRWENNIPSLGMNLHS